MSRLGEEVSGLTDVLIELSGMDTKFARQDSMMISANCKKMSRLELIYTVNSNMVHVLKDEAPEVIPKSCTHYLQDKDKADQIYRLKKEDVPEKTANCSKNRWSFTSKCRMH